MPRSLLVFVLAGVLSLVFFAHVFVCCEHFVPDNKCPFCVLHAVAGLALVVSLAAVLPVFRAVTAVFPRPRIFEIAPFASGFFLRGPPAF